MAEKKVTAKDAAGASPSPTKLQVDASNLTTAYANFCRMVNGPEELMLDFGLNPHPPGQAPGPEPIHLNQRVVMNYLTAKRLLQFLHHSVQQHEKAYGTIELDFRKRMIGNDDPAEG